MLEIVASKKVGDFHNVNKKAYVYDFKLIHFSDISDDLISIVEVGKTLFWNM